MMYSHNKAQMQQKWKGKESFIDTSQHVLQPQLEVPECFETHSHKTNILERCHWLPDKENWLDPGEKLVSQMGGDNYIIDP